MENKMEMMKKSGKKTYLHIYFKVTDLHIYFHYIVHSKIF